MKIRRYKNEDCDTVSELFYETVHAVNARDYTAEQLSVWANSADSLKSRRIDLLKQSTLIAEINGVIVGFGSIDKSGCLDLLFTHKDYRKQGVATALCNALEKAFSMVKTYASITAKPFFEKRGYSVVKAQEVERCGVQLKNYVMIKKNAT
ncbi:MAG: GNAT family N-acetyltransferase [Clostridiales bacterium]|nr:GNAT family N-acetyltransferase [Clostridiales bacterium]